MKTLIEPRMIDPLDTVEHLEHATDLRWRSSLQHYINTYRSISVSPGISLEDSVRLKLYADALTRQITEIGQILEEAEKRLHSLPEVSAKRFISPSEAELRARREHTQNVLLRPNPSVPEVL